jgi:putative Ca2+/H+ antiporter (TMEM165/GDT1 family)
VIDMLALRSPVTGPACRWARPSFQPCRYGRDEGDPFGPAGKVPVNFAIVVAVFPIIFLGELPDKTMFASLVMSTRGRPLLVWFGAAGAFVVHVVIATTIGVALFHLVPHRALDAIVALMFLVGAALAIREARKAEEDESVVEAEPRSGRRVVTTAFVVIFLAEWGDLTQILTANLAAHYHSPLSVGVGSVLALWAVAAIAVVGGQGLLRFINIKTLRIVTAVVLVALAGFAGWEAFR